MPEHLRALVMILAVSAGVFAFAKKPICAAGMQPRAYDRRCMAWYAVTLAAYLSHDYWVFMVLAGAALLAAQHREDNPVALYMAVLLAAPAIPNDVPGFGLMEHFFTIHYLRLVGLALLLPALLRLWPARSAGSAQRRATDFCLFGYLLLNFVLYAMANTLTNAIRQGLFYGFIDVALPYLVASRLVRDRARLNEVLLALLMGCLPVAAVAVIESARGWLLYVPLADALGVRWDMWDIGAYLARGRFVRVQASAGHAIALGYCMMVALGCALYRALGGPPRDPKAWALVGLIGCGLVAPLSRGPWLGAALLVTILFAGDRNARGLLGPLFAAAAVAAGAAVFTGSDGWLDYLPFVGTIDSENVSYRQQLLDVSLSLIWSNPLFGASDYMFSPAMQELKQGQGIIDIVNTYLVVALNSGLVGLGLFAGMYLLPIAAVLQAVRASAQARTADRAAGVLILAVLVAVCFVNATVGVGLATLAINMTFTGLALEFAALGARRPGPRVRGASVAGASADVAADRVPQAGNVHL